ncbi:hypothetical protein KL915_001960 [Ogataea haglerorum]|nr:hypothetical protein KL915_001960 [Ogataea haglerorum]
MVCGQEDRRPVTQRKFAAGAELVARHIAHNVVLTLIYTKRLHTLDAGALLELVSDALDLVLGQTHVCCEGGVRLPLGRGPWGGLLEHPVDLLQSKALGFWDQHHGVQKTAATQRAPDEEHLRSQVALVGVNHVRSDDGNNTVPQPVGGGRQTNTPRSDRQWEDLSDDNPSSRTPGRSKEEDVDADEGDLSLHGVLVLTIDGTGNGHDKLADNHSHGTVNHERTTAELLDRVEGYRSRRDVDDGGDHGGEELVVDGAELLEESRTEVEDEVDTGPLLHHLQGGSEDSLSEVRRRLSESSGETSSPGLPVSHGRNDALFVLVVGHDLGELLLDVVGVHRLASESGEHLGGPVELAPEDKVSWRFWEQEQSNSEDDGPEQLQRNRDSVGARVVSVLSAVVDTGRDEQSDGDEELVARNNGTSDFLWRYLRQIQDHHRRNKTNTNTSYDSSHGQQGHRGGGSLDHNSGRVDTAASHNNGSSSKHVSQVSCKHGTKEGTCRKNRGNKGFLRRAQDIMRVIVAVLHFPGELVDKVVHTHDTRDVTGVVSKEDTS